MMAFLSQLAPKGLAVRLENQLAIRVEQHTPVSTRIVLELAEAHDSDLELTGWIMGPFSRFAKTLPARIPFRPESPTSGQRALAQFPDFCGWSAEHPQLYRVTAELCRRGVVEERVERIWGANLLEIHRQSFFWEGRRWVMRAVETAADLAGNAELLRELDATCIRRDPAESDCREADEQGIRLVARLSGADFPETRQLLARLEQLRRHPSVILVWLEPTAADIVKSENPRKYPGMLLAVDVPRSGAAALPDWTDVGICRRQPCPSESGEATRSRPILVRDSGPSADLSDLRRGCDRLQAAVARTGDFAGFLMTLGDQVE
jgi:hypothetical protein